MKNAVLTAALAACVLAGCAETFGTYPAVESYGEFRPPGEHVAQAWLLGEPQYPKAELARGAEGSVIIDARVSAFGELQDARISPEGAGSEAFVAAVRDALPLWRFYPPLDADCHPTKERIKVRVSFQADEGVPKVNVHGEGPAWKGSNQPQPISVSRPAYPWKISAMRWQDGIVVSARASIDAQGRVMDTTVKAYPLYLSWITLPFEDAARTAILDLKFPPARPGTAEPRHYCTDVVFAAR